jgi:hypothetical protein
MVITVLHPAGEVGLVESEQPDSIAANTTHTGIRINTRNPLQMRAKVLPGPVDQLPVSTAWMAISTCWMRAAAPRGRIMMNRWPSRVTS